MSGARELWIVRLGAMPYGEALELQRAAARARITGAIPQDLLLLVEHEPVVTMGRTAKQQNLTAAPELLAARGVQLFEVERGGDVTYHGPGQLVGYPIVDLKRHKQDLHWYLRQVEEALIVAIGEHGLSGERSTGYTGVWTRGLTGGASHPPRKLASIGVHARDWVTWHGFALNVTTELSFFDLIVPCGIAGVDMTSMGRELGAPVAMGDAEDAAARAFGRVFSLDPVLTPLASLEIEPAAADR
ncbi:MAG TPA: lipoyl(octanoyl) transferase LipB [Gemmatimonadaceae bacterium]|nr:lipoyl(octanoyl) transferase LipB [Gemmatimonadaceae bacterium]